jgi:epoxyqueuosine reductase
VALGNLRDPRAVPALLRALDDLDAIVRGHAAWALGRIGGSDAAQALAGRLDAESDQAVRREMEQALAELTLSGSPDPRDPRVRRG